MSKFQLGDKVRLLKVRTDDFSQVDCPISHIGIVDEILTDRAKDIKGEYFIRCQCPHGHFVYAYNGDIEHLGWSDFQERMRERMS